MSRKTPLFLLLLTLLGSLIFGCSGATPPPEPSDEDVTEAREALLEGYTPLAGPFQTVANFDPMMGDSPENLVIVELNGHTYAFITSLLNGCILRVDLNNPIDVLRIPIPNVPPGSFVAGIDKMPDGRLVFAYSAFGEYGPIASWIKTLDPITNAFGDLSSIEGVALNGVAVYNGDWYSVDPFTPDGIIWKGPLSGGDASPWIQNSQLAPDFSYIPTPCNPPMPVGMNGLRLRVRPAFTYLGVFHPTSFMVSNTTRSNVSRVDINLDGSPGEVAEVFGDVQYPDDIWTSKYCGDVMVAHHGLQISTYFNAFGETTTMTTEPVCDGPTAIYAYGGKVYIVCGGDALICREGAPSPRIVAAPIRLWLDYVCRYSVNLN